MHAKNTQTGLTVCVFFVFYESRALFGDLSRGVL